MSEIESEIILRNGPLITVEIDGQPEDLSNFGVAKFFIPFSGPADHVVPLDELQSAKQAWVNLKDYGYELVLSDNRNAVRRSNGRQGQDNHKRLLDLTGLETGVVMSASYSSRVHSNKINHQSPCCTVSLFRYCRPIPTRT